MNERTREKIQKQSGTPLELHAVDMTLFILRKKYGVFSFSALLLFSSHVKLVSDQKKGNVVEAFLQGSPLSAGEKARSYRREHPSKQLLLRGVMFASEAFCGRGCRGWHTLISALGRHELLALRARFRLGASAGSSATGIL